MLNKWNKAAANMKSLANSYTEKKKLPPTEIHQEIFIRTLKLLGEHCPEAEALIRPNTEIMLPYTIRADEKGDRENGAGRHYYCGCTSNGIPRKPVGGYLLNGKDLFAKSARTMFEEDYTMALTMHYGGFIKQGAIYLARAVHLMSDMCCLPHAAKMTYFSSKRNVHMCYEELARAMYPEFVPEQHLRPEHLHRFSSRSTFSTALNRNTEAICREIPRIFTSPEKEITHRLYDTEAAVAALLYRFYRDTLVSPAYGHYIADGMTCRPFADMPALTVRITERGMCFEFKGTTVNTRFGSTFRAAHRMNGLFSISPLGNDKGLVLTRSNRGLTAFDPRDNRQLISIK